MDRRHFLRSVLSAPLAGAAAGAAPQKQLEQLQPFRITRVTGFRHIGRRPKLVGNNARLGVHGQETREDVLRIATNQGIEGIGIGATKPELARKLVGMTLDQIWRPGVGVVSPLGRADHALFDLVGKALKAPAWRLMGGAGPEWVPVYDGSIYFNDLLPEHKDLGVKRLLTEVESSLKAGHRAFKIKIGRGFKWLERKAGDLRDIEVVRAIRKLVGKEVHLMVDANNGYELDSTVRFLDQVGDTNLYFIEEMFEEQVDQDLKLKEHIRKRGWTTLVADGESAREVKHFEPFIERGALDVLQPDIRAFGLTLQWELSRRLKARPAIKLAPHNWGSHLGLHMQLVLARGIPNFLIAEEDISTSDLFDTSAFTFKDGRARVPDIPGCGLSLREEIFKKHYAAQAWVVEK
jgi:D-galactarolactone cycloisomerase